MSWSERLNLNLPPVDETRRAMYRATQEQGIPRSLATEIVRMTNQDNTYIHPQQHTGWNLEGVYMPYTERNVDHYSSNPRSADRTDRVFPDAPPFGLGDVRTAGNARTMVHEGIHRIEDRGHPDNIVYSDPTSYEYADEAALMRDAYAGAGFGSAPVVGSRHPVSLELLAYLASGSTPEEMPSRLRTMAGYDPDRVERTTDQSRNEVLSAFAQIVSNSMERKAASLPRHGRVAE